MRNVRSSSASLLRRHHPSRSRSELCFDGSHGNGRTVVILLILGLVLGIGFLIVLCGVGFWFSQNPDYTIRMDDVRDWERRHGPIPESTFVALRTDWSKRWPDAKAKRNEDDKGVAHYPGWSLDVLKYLYEERKTTASGHQTTDTDPGVATSKGDYSLETYVLGTDHYQIELLASLDRVPEAGAIVVAAFPKPKGGSGFPARVFAVLP